MFTTDLIVQFVEEGPERCLWKLVASLKYVGNGLEIEVPAGFHTDFASVPRSALTMEFFGKFNMEAVVHDYLYRADSFPNMSQEQADAHLYLMLEQSGRYDPVFCHIVYEAVKFGGKGSFHKRKVMDILSFSDEGPTT